VTIAKRQVDSAAVAALAPAAALFPIWLLAIGVFWLPFWRFSDVSYPLFAFAALALGVLLFSKAIQRIFLSRLLEARKPSTLEAATLQQAWRRVAQANHISIDSFVLAVVDSNEINAFASGGHLVVVSSYAVNQLDQNELTGVLAHEISHHLGSHTVALTIAQWLSLPILLLARIGFILQRVAERISNTFKSGLNALKFIGLLISAALTVVSSLFVSQALSNAVGHESEFQADRRAVRMGFGNELLIALKHVVDDSQNYDEQTSSALVVSAHPPVRERINRLEALLRTEDPYR
jgi:Zn-dependent protease with chaperone function